MFKKQVWLGITAILAFILALILCITPLVYNYAAAINSFFNISTTKVVSPGDPDYPGNATGNKTDTQYFKSEFGEFTKENQAKLIESSFEQAITEMKEGAALLYNKNNALPLNKKTESVSLFGRATVTPFACIMSAGTRPQPGYFANIYTAMKGEGFKVNDELYNILDTYPNPGIPKPTMQFTYGTIKRGTSDVEDSIDVYDNTAKETWRGAGHENEVAVYTITRSGSEGSDMPMYDDANHGQSSLSLHDKEKAILSMLKEEKVAGNIKKIIILLNTANPMELEWLDDYDVDACMFISSVGSQGARGVASILSGETNPSGHVVDTFAVNSLSAPATVNSSDNTSKFTNFDEIDKKLNADIPDGAKYDEQAGYLTFQAEGIYIGYKYYETRYEDYVLGRGNANGSNGASNGASSWQYQNEISYPFGHGLSYTTFNQTLDSVTYNEATDSYKVNVTVVNTGNVAGKSVVQVYAQTPYGNYEKNNKVEKSAVTIVDFGKTKMLQPGASEQLTINVDKYLLASYDYVGAKGYIISEGDYYLAIGDNAHDALNNIIAKKIPNAKNLINFDGTSCDGDADKAYKWNMHFDSESYKKSSEGVLVTNRFDDCDINYWVKNSGTYLSRSDWQGTYPTTQTTIKASDEMMYWLKGEYYEKPENAPSAQEVIDTLGNNKGISFVTMKDIAYDNEVQWKEFLQQMTLDELLSVCECYNGRKGIPSVGLPDTFIGDGVDGIMKGNPMNGNLYPFDYEDTTGKYGSGLIEAKELRATRYPGKTILTMTFNKDLYKRRGELLGEEGLWSNNTKGLVELFGIGVDLHRPPLRRQSRRILFGRRQYDVSCDYSRSTGNGTKRSARICKTCSRQRPRI